MQVINCRRGERGRWKGQGTAGAAALYCARIVARSEIPRSPQPTLPPKLRRLLPRPFSRGEGWGEGLPGVVYSAVLAVPVAIVTLFPASQAIAREKAGHNEMRICHAGHTRGLAFGARTRKNQTGVRLCSCASGELGSACSTGTVQTTSMGWGLAKASRALRTSAPQSRSRLNTSTKVISGTPNRRR